LYASLKDRFQSLRELRVQIQDQKDQSYADTWIRTCLVLHNMIGDIEEKLGIASSVDSFAAEYPQEDVEEEDEEQQEEQQEEEEEEGPNQQRPPRTQG
jgi:hypothetical protein